MTDLIWPLPGIAPVMPPSDGQFAAQRKFDVHSGFDLYCPDGSLVVAMQRGVVLSVIDFTGPDAGSPWWNPTQAVMVRGEKEVILYGELITYLKRGDVLAAGHEIGWVARVLKKDKSRPTSMLHLERYSDKLSEYPTRTITCCELWTNPYVRPEGLLDPWPLLKEFY